MAVPKRTSNVNTIETAYTEIFSKFTPIVIKPLFYF